MLRFCRHCILYDLRENAADPVLTPCKMNRVWKLRLRKLRPPTIKWFICTTVSHVKTRIAFYHHCIPSLWWTVVLITNWPCSGLVILGIDCKAIKTWKSYYLRDRQFGSSILPYNVQIRQKSTLHAPMNKFLIKCSPGVDPGLRDKIAGIIRFSQIFLQRRPVSRGISQRMAYQQRILAGKLMRTVDGSFTLQ